MPMDKLDGIVISEVTKQILQPEHLVTLLSEYLRTALEREDRNRDQLRQMRHDHKEAEAGIPRLLELVEKGLMDAEDASMRERLVNLRFRRDELAEQISDLTRRLAMAEPVITPAKIEKLATLLRDKLHHGSPDLRQAYARLLLSEVRVNDREIRISGSKAVLARSAAGGVAKITPAALSFVRQWRAWNAMNGYTHGGIHQISRRMQGEYIEPCFEDDSLLEVVQFSGTMALIAFGQIAALAGRDDLVVEADEMMMTGSSKSAA